MAQPQGQQPEVALAIKEAEPPASPSGSKAEKEKEEVPVVGAQQVPFLQLFSTADTLDIVLMVVGVVGAMGNGIAWPVFAIVFGNFTDTFGSVSGNFMDDVRTIALNFVYIAIGAMVGAALQTALWMWAGHRQTARIRLQYLHAVLRQDMSFFDTQASTSSLLQGLNEDSSTVQAAISEKVSHFVQHMTTFIAGLIIAFVIGWDMTLVMVGALPLIAVMGAVLARVTAVMENRSQSAYTQASGYTQQAMSQIRTVQAYNGEKRAVDEYAEQLVQPTRTGIVQSLYTGAALGGVNCVVYSTYSAAFYYGAWRVSTGDYTGGKVLQVFVSALLGGFSLGQAAPVLESFARGKSAGARLFGVIRRQPAIDVDNASGKELDKATMSGSLELRDVVFSYPTRPDVRVFNGFNLVIPGGKTVALVGNSGSGKSTVVQLIERYYDPLSGSVLLDGVDMRALNLKWMRSQIGLVSQEPTLFATTIYENIAMGKSDATPEEVKAAAAAANAHNFISHLPLGYDTQVGERGLQLSGGQKQRVAIARAILKNPKILLLDEATSALDTHSERIVQAALEGLMVGRTTVVVAHRLSTIRGADLIAVVKGGQVSELGSHEELIRDPVGTYSTLVALQMAEEAERQEFEHEEDEVTHLDGIEEEEQEMVDVDGPTPDRLPSAAAPGVSDAAASVASAATAVGTRTSAQMKRISVERKGSAEKLKRASGSGELPIKAGGKTPSLELKVVTSVDSSDDEAAGKKKAKDQPAVNVPFSRLLKLNKPEWGYGLVGMVASAGNGAIQPLFALFIASFVVVFYDKDKSNIMHDASFWSWMFFCLGVASLIFSTGQQFCFGTMGCQLARRIRVMLFGNILRQEIGWFDLDENSSGTLTTKLATDAAHVRGAVGDTVGLIIQNIITLVTGYVISFVYDWRMALLVTGALPFMIFGSLLYYKNITSEKEGSSKLFGAANQAVTDAFTSIRVVQAYNLQDHMMGLYRTRVRSADSESVKKALISGALLGYSQLSIFAVYGLIIYFGGVEVDAGRVDFEGMFKSFLAILLAAMGIAQAQIGFPNIGKAKAAVQSIFPLMDRTTGIDTSAPGVTAGTGEAQGLQGAIKLVQVDFAYPARPSVIVFRNFSLDIPAGQMVALVGESGSGKSTIVGLILRYYDVMAGSVLLDGTDIRQYQLQWLRSHIGLVSQEPLLFNCSVLDNIKYGKPDASMEEVEAAARAANAYDFIMALPEGFNTRIGEKGVQLSGGQKQRVAIARAVIKQPRILLLDEATSALDAASERVVQEALDTIMVGRTSVVVAHRLSTIRNANKIALVHRGHVLEQGTHAELMALPDGGYARLVIAQGGTASMQRSASKSSLAPSKSRQRLADGCGPASPRSPVVAHGASSSNDSTSKA